MMVTLYQFRLKPLRSGENETQGSAVLRAAADRVVRISRFEDGELVKQVIKSPFLNDR